jgi:hypothetical protein
MKHQHERLCKNGHVRNAKNTRIDAKTGRYICRRCAAMSQELRRLGFRGGVRRMWKGEDNHA